MVSQAGGIAAFLEDGNLVSQPSPLGEGSPKGQIGHKRYEKSGKEHLKSTIYESTLSTALRSPFPMRGRLIGGGFAAV